MYVSQSGQLRGAKCTQMAKYVLLGYGFCFDHRSKKLVKRCKERAVITLLSINLKDGSFMPRDLLLMIAKMILDLEV